MESTQLPLLQCFPLDSSPPSTMLPLQNTLAHMASSCCSTCVAPAGVRMQTKLENYARSYHQAVPAYPRCQSNVRMLNTCPIIVAVLTESLFQKVEKKNQRL